MIKRQDFIQNTKLASLSLSGRKSSFVLVPGVPDEDNHKRLIEFGENTIFLLRFASKKKSLVLPRVIFLTDQKTSPNLPHENLFETYLPKILNEKQLPIEFHIASHGDQNRVFTDPIGLIDVDNGIKIAHFAKQMDDLLTQQSKKNSEEVRRKPLHFVFHTCNSAHCDLNSKEDIALQSHCVLNNTLIGKFARHMRAMGYTHVTVSGFRGYYQTLLGGYGAVVRGSTGNETVPVIQAQNAMFTVHPDFSVTFPKSAYFKVDGVSQLNFSQYSETSTAELLTRTSPIMKPKNKKPKVKNARQDGEFETMSTDHESYNRINT